MKKYLAFCFSVFILFFIVSCEKNYIKEDVTTNNNSTDSGTSETDKGVSHENADDYVWDSSTVSYIVLNGSSITADTSVAVAGCIATIKYAGTYRISGSLTNGQIIVNTDDKQTVRLILDGVNITSSVNAPIFIENAEKAIIILAEGTENFISDASSYLYDNKDITEPNAALFSKADLTIYGSGSLTVSGNYNDGISSKDGLIIKNCTIAVTASDDGIRGKDYLIVDGGNITINAGGNGMKSDNEEDASVGYISIGSGTISIISANDGIHSNGSMAISGGSVAISATDDGLHAEESISLTNCEVTISKSYEGIESANITVDNSNVSIVATDDGFNATHGTGGEQNDNSYLTIKSGTIHVNSSVGDGLDSNGNIVITGGTIVVNGPSSQPEVGMDYNGTCVISGGFLTISGTSSNMTQSPSTTSTQYSVLVMFTSAKSANSIIHIEDSEGNDILTFAPLHAYQSVILSSSSLTKGETYTIYTGGSSTGTLDNGLYTGGIYTAGTNYASFTISSIVTTVGTISSGGGGGPGSRP